MRERITAKPAPDPIPRVAVNALGGFTGAVLLGVFAAMMAWESIDRLINPVTIMFNQAILVAFVYSANLHERATIEDLTGEFLGQLSSVVADASVT